jgi:hypothetical protein
MVVLSKIHGVAHLWALCDELGLMVELWGGPCSMVDYLKEVSREFGPGIYILPPQHALACTLAYG